MRTIIGLAALARSGKDTVASMLLSYPGVAAFALADPLKVGCQALFGLTDEETWCDDLKEKTIELWGRSPREFFQTVGTEWMRNHNPEHWLMRADREINPPHLAVDEHRSTSGAKGKEAHSPFTLAAKAFFDLSDEQLLDAEKSSIQDPVWGLSPADAVELIKRHTYEMYPNFDSRRNARPVEPLKPRGQIPAEASTVIFKDIRFENEAAFLRSHNGQIWHITRPNLKKVNEHSSEHGIAQPPEDVLIVNDGSLRDLEKSVEEAWLRHQTSVNAVINQPL
ncbi:MAG: deoxynucleotide monophosphate kinase [Candidatus Pseudomonas phytovorans]|uniref:Deoxynucleotide monophosphate kinase n=1 Tax=Candidatus Pseudomonas phytovorans TaxID=3121377 RepID=A0AAJ5WF82_9PSED|nr:deoxynucleotide monophosphate kinase [Pseudomonas sp.]WEK29592.1 MAG: deoxynucleotide monophosphate kinase [Pseudomonas sp.]